MLMPFGKHKGRNVSELPPEYLKWLWENIELREPLRTAIKETIGFDHAEKEPEGLSREKVRAVYRKLALKYHPDHGGNHLAQVAINEFYEMLGD